MKLKIFLSLFIVSSSFASPLEQMKNRINNYQEMMAPEHCAISKSNNDFAGDDYGLMTSIECEFTCRGKSSQRQRSAASFIPKSYGLYPGDGSNDKNTLWRSVGVTMQVWSEEVCLELAANTCSNLSEVEKSEAIQIESGEWKLNQKLDCENKAIVLSPFDQSVKSKRIPAPIVSSLEVIEKSHSLEIFEEVSRLSRNSKQSECKHNMGASLCFGDCVYEMPNKEWKETFSTPAPYATGVLEWCMDDAVELIKSNKNLSRNIHLKICEAYFWSSLMHKHESGSSCAAVRGSHQCEKLIDSL